LHVFIPGFLCEALVLEGAFMYRLTLILASAASFFLTAPLSAGAAQENGTPLVAPADAEEARLSHIQQQLHPLGGDVVLPGADAVLHLGRDYYFLGPGDARLVLTQGWGNPPELAEGVLGMVFPAGATLMDESWGATITYGASGHVGDGDAGTVDPEALLAALRGDEAAINAERAAEGLPASHLAGWAQRPAYEALTHSVSWARDLRIAGQPENMLSYDVRLLGRRGVLGFSMIATMARLAETRAAARRLAASAEFLPGARYADYRAGADPLAAYGVAGLVAAGVGAPVAPEAGLLASILAYRREILVLLALFAGVFLLRRPIRGLFTPYSAASARSGSR